jgi:hypothetical protein
MGGKSTGSFAVENQLGIFDGEVVDVPFLKAPGFIKASVVDMMPGGRWTQRDLMRCFRCVVFMFFFMMNGGSKNVFVNDEWWFK